MVEITRRADPIIGEKHLSLMAFVFLFVLMVSACTQRPIISTTQAGPEVSTSGPPRVQISVSSISVKPGELVTATVTVTNIDSPTYFLVMRDSGVTVASKILGVTDENIVLPGTRSSNVLECISARGKASQAVFVLRALLGGRTELWVSVLPGGNKVGGEKSWLSQVIQVKVSQ